MGKILLPETASFDTPASGYGAIGVDTSGRLSFINDAGNELKLAAAGDYIFTVPATGTAALWEQTSWTPALRFGGATTGITYSAQVGAYAMLGASLVLARFEITLSSKGSATGSATIAGLPYAADARGGAVFWRFVDVTASITGPLMAYVPGSGSTIALGQFVSNAWGALTDANCTNTTNLQGFAVYFK